MVKELEVPVTESSIIPYHFNNNTIRVLRDDSGEPLFVASDICAALDLGNVSQALSRLDEDEKGDIIINDAAGRPNKFKYVTESGLYNLVFDSRKPEARGFRRWIAHEVIPSIHKTGQYTLKPMTAIELIAAQAQALVEQERRLNALDQRVGHIEDSYKAGQGEAQMMTVAAYAKYHDLRLSEGESANAGKVATLYSGRNGYPIETTTHRVWGKVNLYHIDVLKVVFQQRRLFEGKPRAE